MTEKLIKLLNESLEAGVSKHVLSDACDVTESSIDRWLAGKNLPLDFAIPVLIRKITETRKDNFNLKEFLQEAFEHGVTAREIADESGLSKSAVDRWAEGSTRPHPCLLPAIKEIVEDLKSLKGDFNFASFVRESLEQGAPEQIILGQFGISEQTLERWKTGKVEPQAFALLKVVKFIKSISGQTPG